MLKIAICDDNQNFTNYFEEIIEEIYPNNQFSIDIFNNPIRLSKIIKENKYDIFFLDIEMPELNGIDLAKKIRVLDNKAFIIFLTSYSQYMKDVFKVTTFDYLLKPIDKVELKNSINRIQSIFNTSFNYFKYTKGNNIYRITFNDIIYFEKNGRYTILHGTTVEDKFIMSTENLVEQLDYSFIRIHKSFIVNSKYIEILKKDSVQCTLTSMYSTPYIQLSFGRKYKSQARNQLFKILEAKI